MGQNNETTTKFKVDISELVSGMQSAKRQIALANAEFKSATAGMDNWGKSADGVSAKLTQLDKTLTSQKSILDSLESQYKLTVEQMGEGSKEAENLKIKIENQKASIANTEKQIGSYTESLADIKKESAQSETAVEKLSNTIKKQESELGDLKTAYANAVLEYGKNSSQAKDLAKQIDSLSGELSDNESKMNEATGASKDLSKAVDDAGDSASGAANDGFTVMKGALANLVASGIKFAIDGFKDLITSTDQAANTFKAATGASAEAMEKYKGVIEDIYKDNFGESLQDVAEKMAKVKEVTGEVDPSKLKELTEAGLTLEDTFGMDLTETLRGVNALTDHFGISAKQAFDLMASGAQQGLNYTDELGDNVSEYSGKFAEAGYSAGEYFQLLKNGSQGGAYNLDKVNDSINEVTARMADGTIEKGIGGFSSKTQELFKAWQNGEASQKDVIASIVGDIQSTTNEQEKMNLAALAFGTMAEDGGTKFIQSLSSVGDAFNDTKGKMDEIKQTRYDDVMSQLSGLGRTVKTDVITPFVEQLLPYVKEGVQYVIDNMPAITEALDPVVKAVGELIKWIVDNKDVVIAGLAGMAAAMATMNVANMIFNAVKAYQAFKTAQEGATVAQWLMNAAMNANPIGIIVSLIAGLVVAFVVLWNKSEAFRNFWINLWDNIQEKASVVIEAVTGFFSGLWDSISSGLSAIGDFFGQIFSFIGSLIKNYIDLWLSVFNFLWSGVVKIFTPAIQWFTKLFTSIWYTLSSIVSVIIELLKGCWLIITTVFGIASSWFNDKVIQPVAKFFKNMWDLISTGAKLAWDFIAGIFTGVAKWYYNTVVKPVAGFFSNMWSNLASGASQAWSGIKSVFSKVADFFGKIFGDAWSKVKSVFSVGGKIFDGIKDGIASAFTSVVNSIIRGINKVVAVPFSAINGVLNTLRSFSIMEMSPFSGLPNISVPSIPELYKGGVLRKGQVGYLEGNGDEAVVPLEHNTGWLDEVASRIVDKGGLTNSTPQTVNNKYNYEFNQTNNSPKALSRLEIYRQTKNLTTYSMGVI